MYSYHDWLLMRELVLVLMFVLLVLGSILIGSRSRRKQSPDTEAMVDQEASTSAAREASASSMLLHRETETPSQTPRRAA